MHILPSIPSLHPLTLHPPSSPSLSYPSPPNPLPSQIQGSPMANQNLFFHLHVPGTPAAVPQETEFFLFSLLQEFMYTNTCTHMCTHTHNTHTTHTYRTKCILYMYMYYICIVCRHTSTYMYRTWDIPAHSTAPMFTKGPS